MSGTLEQEEGEGVNSEDHERLIALVDELRALSTETEWVEFKKDNTDPEVIGKRISALSNGARLKDKNKGYMVWGVEDETHSVVGTKFKGNSTKAKGQPLAFWLTKSLGPELTVDFKEVNHPDGRIVLLEIDPAMGTPTKFKSVAYIRIGDATPPLSDYARLEKQLWSRLQAYAWEKEIARQRVEPADLRELLNYEDLFPLLGHAVPQSEARTIELLLSEGLITKDVGGRYSILNIAACLMARDLKAFPGMARKAVRLIQYTGTSRVHGLKEDVVNDGYAVSFEWLIDDIMQATAIESIGSLREKAQPFPRAAVRELVANCLVHQDMTTTGAGPTIEIFKDRIEITNPGRSLVDPQRFIDMPPRSRNETLAALMRRMKICEERGSGIDRVIQTVEDTRLPAPHFATSDESTRATLLGPKSFALMTATERVRACYQHTCLLHQEGKRATNATLRARFGLPASGAAQASRVFKDTRDEGLIKLADPRAIKGGYVPNYA